MVHNTCPCVSSSSRFDLRTLPVDFVECLMRFQPTENEIKVLRQFEKERKPLESLTDEDRFMMQFSKIERLMQKMTIMAFIGNFAESVQMLTPVNNDATLSFLMFLCCNLRKQQRCAGFDVSFSPTATACSHCSICVHQVITETEEDFRGNGTICVPYDASCQMHAWFPFSFLFAPVLQIILALGNYMNSSKRGAVYGFKLQSLDLVTHTHTHTH